MPAVIGGLRTGEAARVLGVSEQSVRSWARAGRLPYTATPYGALFDTRAVHTLAAQRERIARTRSGGRHE